MPLSLELPVSRSNLLNFIFLPALLLVDKVLDLFLKPFCSSQNCSGSRFFKGEPMLFVGLRFGAGMGGRGGSVHVVLRGKNSNAACTALRRPCSTMKLNHGVRRMDIFLCSSLSPSIIEVRYDDGIWTDSRWIQCPCIAMI
jgi:hypothetical protein